MTTTTRSGTRARPTNFRGTVLVAVEAAAQAGKGGPGPVRAEMTRKITGAVDAA
ncbi:hypothetical protein ACFWA5_06100 [Streptomyces mirabilis]|uniref:hypothetical protein n=1 Tax=Streptomyces mirabilis TaxID=68239 RepID=UPI003654A311